MRNAGYLVHPTIADRLLSNVRIADVATGTGVWALDVAKLLPNAQLVAFDISSAQFPTSGPDNVKFIVADARKPFPEADHGSFDLVHIRALIAALQSADWDVVMHNVVQLLKPGGMVQWYESDYGNFRCLRNNPEYVRYTAIPKLLEKFKSIMGDRLTAPGHRLPEVAVARLENVELDIHSTDRVPETRAQWMSQAVIALLAWAENNSGWSAEELDQVKSGIKIDIDNGVIQPLQCRRYLC